MKLYDKIVQEGNWDDFLKADKYKDIKSEDIIQIENKKYLFSGVWPTGLQETVCKDAHLYTAFFNFPYPNGMSIRVFKNFSFWKKVGHMSKEEWIKNSGDE